MKNAVAEGMRKKIKPLLDHARDETINIGPENIAKVVAKVRKQGAVFHHDLVDITREELGVENPESLINFLEAADYFKKSQVGQAKDKSLVSDKEIVYTITKKGEELANRYL